MIENDNLEQELKKYNEKIMYLFVTLQKDFRDYFFEKSKQYGFSGSQLILISTINKNPGINLQDLSKKIYLSNSTVSGMIDRMVSQGHVIREIPEDNRRTVKLYLSKDFLNKFDIEEIRSSYLSNIAMDASAEELKEIINGLEKFHELIKKSRM
jgi:MarR family transcriptional regulator, organic hydroperoxide resistance regulator